MWPRPPPLPKRRALLVSSNQCHEALDGVALEADADQLKFLLLGFSAVPKLRCDGLMRLHKIVH